MENYQSVDHLLHRSRNFNSIFYLYFFRIHFRTGTIHTHLLEMVHRLGCFRTGEKHSMLVRRSSNGTILYSPPFPRNSFFVGILRNDTMYFQTSEQTLAENSDAKWCVHSRHQKLLADVRTCIDNIDSLEMASASLYFVVNHLPPGKKRFDDRNTILQYVLDCERRSRFHFRR